MGMKKIGFILFSCMLALPVFAQQTPGQNVRTAAQQEIQQIRTSATESIEAARTAMRAEIEKRQEEFKSMMREQREKTKKRIEEKQKTLRERLQTIKNENKKRIVENIDTRMDALNEQRTTQFESALDQMDGVVGRVVERADRAEAQGRDVASARAAIVHAKNAIASARSAVLAQAGKTYAITITTDAKLKDDVKKTRDMFSGDLRVVFASVKDARDAVHAAAVAVEQTAQGEKEKTATSSNSNQ